MEEYLNQLMHFFEKDDMDSFYELKEDLMEQLSEGISEGYSESEIVSKLASPSEVATDYFTEKNMEIVVHAKSIVVPKEEIQEVFKDNFFNKIHFIISKLKRMLSSLIVFIATIVLVYLLLYILVEIGTEENLARIPVILSGFLLSFLLFKTRSKYNKQIILSYVSLLLLLVTVFLLY